MTRRVTFFEGFVDANDGKVTLRAALPLTMDETQATMLGAALTKAGIEAAKQNLRKHADRL